MTMSSQSKWKNNVRHVGEQNQSRQLPLTVTNNEFAVSNYGDKTKLKCRPVLKNQTVIKNYLSNNQSCPSFSSNVNDMIPPGKSETQNLFYENASIFTSSGGIIHVSLRNGIRIDITVDNSIRLTSCAGQIVVSLSKNGEASAVKHPNGLVEQSEKCVQISANDGSKKNNYVRYAKMSTNGIHFTSNKLVEVFMLDSIGTRQSKEYFSKLTLDRTSAVFFGASNYGSNCDEDVFRIIQKASYNQCFRDGMEVITVNDYRIWQMKDGLVTATRMSFPFEIRTSPINCSYTLSTPKFHSTASLNNLPHLFVRCQDQSMHFDGSNFIVRYNGNSAGFDINDFLIVY